MLLVPSKINNNSYYHYPTHSASHSTHLNKLLLILAIMLSHLTRTSTSFILPSSHYRALLSTSNISPYLLTKTSLFSTTPTKKPPSPYASTVRLPSTSFTPRAESSTREPEIQKFWDTINLQKALRTDPTSSSVKKQKFTLHDGPPYANGDLHIGHALNKVLKDIINRRMILKGYEVNYRPGWDCHGLPIELKVLTGMKQSERDILTTAGLRSKAAAFAEETVGKQSEQFKRYGVYGDFETPYLTLDKDFEEKQLGVFGEMFMKGHIYRGKKPVHWSPSSRTALAEAELEYPDDHVSQSIYVAFKVDNHSDVLKAFEDVKIAVWTTTPWTIPANMAVAVNPNLDYSVVEHPETGKIILATDLISNFEKIMNFNLPEKTNKKTNEISPPSPPFTVITNFPGSSLNSTTYIHPLTSNTHRVLMGGDYITTESGTGLVHTAPGHGMDDFILGMKSGLSLFSPVDDAGRFTSEAGEDFVGLDVLGNGNVKVIEALKANGSLIKVRPYPHKYPYDWRTKKPIILRATSQWFASVEGFRDEALSAIDTVKWIPSVGKNRITSFISGRNDWCISRQRSWGVPIPVFYDASGEGVLLNRETIDHVMKIVSEHGTDAWFNLPVIDLLPDSYKHESSNWTKGTDTMDVWFDSGSSWSSVLLSNPADFNYPADLYVEGSDQHRGWFQSSLLTSVAANGKAPYKAVLTHGFVLDEKGMKMSKSLGNVVSPLEIIEGGSNKKVKPAYGADVLRLWVASVDYSGDVRVGDGILKQTFESYRKIRNTVRYMLGNLNDFDPKVHSIDYENLPKLDQYILAKLSRMLTEVDHAYNDYNYSKVVFTLLRFVTSDLSNFYLDSAKDRLYISEGEGFRRRSCQTVLHLVLEGVVKGVAPILPHLAEDIYMNWDHGQGGSQGGSASASASESETKSVFQTHWPDALLKYGGKEIEEMTDYRVWEKLREIRNDANKALEVARTDKLVGSSMDAALYISIDGVKEDGDLVKALNDMKIDVDNNVDELKYALMLSQVHIVDDIEESGCSSKYIVKSGEGESGMTVGIKRAKGVKCERCWYFDESVGSGECGMKDLCVRCDGIVKNMGFVRPVGA